MLFEKKKKFIYIKRKFIYERETISWPSTLHAETTSQTRPTSI